MESSEDDRKGLLSSDQSSRAAEYSALPINFAANKIEHHSLVGDVRNIKRFSWVEWTFLAFGILAFLATLGLTIERFIFFETHFNASSSSPNTSNGTEAIEQDTLTCDHWTCLSDFTFSIVLIANIIICFFYGIDGVLREKSFELLGIVFAIVLILLYITINFFYHIDNNDFYGHELTVRIIRIALAWILSPILAALAFLTYKKMGQIQFLVIGGNKELILAYHQVSFLSSLIFFNIHALINLIILACTGDFEFLSLVEKIILPIFSIYVIALSLVGWIGMFYELYSWIIVFLIFLTPTAAYYIYKIVNVVQKFSDYNSAFDTGDPLLARSHEFVAITLIVVNILALFIFALIYIFAVLVMKNFGKGLKDKIQPPCYWCYKKISNTDEYSLPATND